MKSERGCNIEHLFRISYVAGLISCSLFILFAIFLRRKTNFVANYGIHFISTLLIVRLIRLFLPYEFSFTKSIY